VREGEPQSKREKTIVSANTDLVRRLIATFNRRDAAQLADLITDTVKHTAAGTTFNADLEGRNSYIEYMKNVLSNFHSINFEPYNMYEDQKAGVVIAEWRADFITSGGVPFSSNGAFVVEIRDGQIEWVRDYFDTEKTKQAMS